MSSKRSSDLPFSDADLPTSPGDLRALREHRPMAGGDWLEQLTSLARQLPQSPGALRRRRTFAGLAPFEL